MDFFVMDPTTTRDIAPEVLDSNQRLRVLPASYWAATTPQERQLFGFRHGLYSFPTVELIARLQELIAGRSAIEIGAGHGVLAAALDIPATDNRMQEMPKYRRILGITKQPPVRYGPNVQRFAADAAVRHFRPEVVIAAWVTHRYDPKRHHAGGNEIGVDEIDILAHCQHYILIGNTHVHRGKEIWQLPHQIQYPPFVFSRSRNPQQDFLAVWPGHAR